MDLKKLIPILTWLPNYKRSYLNGDISAGLIVGVMLIPQGMSYAMIAGLPPVYGLYAALVPQLAYSIFGTSRQLSVGPVALDSLLVAAGLSGIAVLGSENYISLSITLAFLMGAILVLFGIFRLGLLVNFLSKPVISGFTTAVAIIITVNQLKYFAGIEVPRNLNVLQVFKSVFSAIDEINWITFIVGGLAVLTLKFINKLHKLIPSALIVVLAGTLFSFFFDFEKMGGQIVGDVPGGLPNLSAPNIQLEQVVELLPIAFSLAVIAFMEAVSVAKIMHDRHRGDYEIDNNQEMLAIGLGNIFGSFFGSYSTTGGFGRTAVNDLSGAKTNLSAIIAAAVVAVTLLFFTPLFYYLPNAVLGAIIVVAVLGLVDLNYPVYLWKTKKQDFLMLLVTFLCTVLVGVMEGITAGVIISLVLLIYRTTVPHFAVLGRLPETKDYRNIERFNEIEILEDVLVLRHDAQLYFANVNHFIESVKREVYKKGDCLKLLVLHCGSISSIDATALHEVEILILDLNNQGVEVAFSGMIGPVRDFLHKSGFIDEVGRDKFFVDVESAIQFLRKGRPTTKKFKYALQTNIFKEGI